MGYLAAIGKQLEVYRGHRVLVTGHTGFKGSWLALWLGEMGADVLGYALEPSSDQDHFRVLGLRERINHVVGDIRDRDRFLAVCEEFRPEFVFHLAAQALVRSSYEDPWSTFSTNVLGSVAVLEACRLVPSVRTLVLITSDKCYRNKEWDWGYRENDELGGRDPYSASKAAAELVFAAYRESFFTQRPELGAATTRAGNVIGGGDWAPDRIVPDCIRALREGRPLVVRSPHATRPWQHVLEPLCGYLLLGARLWREPERYSGSWNFGPAGGTARTVEVLARGIIDRWESGDLIVDELQGFPYEARFLHLSIDKAMSNLGWRPRWDFEETLDHTVDWYRAVLGGADAIDVSRSQIDAYMQDDLD